MNKEGEVDIDAVTFAVIKNKLRSIVDDQTLAIQHMSGSPIVNEAADFNNGLFFRDSGLSLEMGLHAPVHADSLGKMVRCVTEECRENPGISEDDQFFCNDPWRGAIHQSDVGVMAPIYYHGELVTWSGCLAHQLDIGGAEFGGWVPWAKDVYQEAVPIPPIKLVEKGKLRRDIWNMLLAHSRLPFLVGLDLKALIGANNVAKRRFLELADRYGIEVIKAVMEGMVKATEERLREKLRAIPDGVYRSVAFINHDGHQNKLYKVMVKATKADDRLVLDFTGTDAQAPGFINMTESSALGAVGTATLSCLGFDMDWNGGIFKAIQAIIPKGTVINAEYPAPVGGATVNIQFVAIGALHQVFAQMLACSDKYRRDEVSVAPDYYSVIFNMGGLNQYGEPFGTLLTDTAIVGEGAYSFKDGAYMMSDTPIMSIADIESNESVVPILYLYRRLAADTGGAGKWNGGFGGEIAFVAYDIDVIPGSLLGTGNETPQPGLFGGQPGGCNRNTIVKNSDIMDRFKQDKGISNLDELQGQKSDLGTKPGVLNALPGDVYAITCQGAGGYGDPLEREPERTLQDVIDGRTSLEGARSLYGVIIDPRNQTVDIEQTKRERQAIREQRLALGKGIRMVAQQDAARMNKILTIGEYLEVIAVDDKKLVRCRCGYQFGPPSQNWKENAIRTNPSAEKCGPYVRLHEELEIRQYICPACGLSLCMEVARKGDPLLFEVELKA